MKVIFDSLKSSSVIFCGQNNSTKTKQQIPIDYSYLNEGCTNEEIYRELINIKNALKNLLPGQKKTNAQSLNQIA